MNIYSVVLVDNYNRDGQTGIALIAAPDEEALHRIMNEDKRFFCSVHYTQLDRTDIQVVKDIEAVEVEGVIWMTYDVASAANLSDQKLWWMNISGLDPEAVMQHAAHFFFTHWPLAVIEYGNGEDRHLLSDEDKIDSEMMGNEVLIYESIEAYEEWEEDGDPEDGTNTMVTVDIIAEDKLRVWYSSGTPIMMALLQTLGSSIKGHMAVLKDGS